MTPSVSVIIATFNSEATLDACLRSVITQSVAPEIVIVDGLSTDRTLEIIDQYRSRIAKLVSERDAGLYDALNKGASLASGKYIYVLGSDDELAHGGALAELLAAPGDCDVIYGKVYVRDTSGIVRPSQTLPLEKYKYQMPFSHQGAIVKRDLVLNNPFGSSFASDYRQLFKLYLDGARFCEVDTFIATFSLGGVSDIHAVGATLDRWRINFELRGARTWDVSAYYAFQVAVCYLKPRLMRLLGKLVGT